MLRLALIGTAIATLTSAAAAQLCPPEPRELILPAGLVSGDDYGFAVAVVEDWLFVGAPMDVEGSFVVGSVYVFQLEGGTYELRQKLFATGGVGHAHFGYSLAVHNDVLIVGAENDREITGNDPNAWGAAYIFRLQDGQWVQQQKLLPFGPGTVKQHGFRVAVRDDVAVVGAKQVIGDGVNNKGAAYLYRFNGESWINEQRLTAPTPTQDDWFGTALAMTADVILIGSPQNDDVGSNAGAVFVFTHVGQGWALHSTLYPSGTPPSDYFGTDVAVSGARLIVGAPGDAQPPNQGAVYAYQWDRTQWVADGKIGIAPTELYTSLGAGRTLAINGDVMLVGAPHANMYGPGNGSAGMALVYQRINGVWVKTRLFSLWQGVTLGQSDHYGRYECWLSGPQPDSSEWPSWFNDGHFSRAVVISSAGFVCGARLVRTMCWPGITPDQTGAVYVFGPTYSYPDCNQDLLHDACMFMTGDCNGNDVPDQCEVALPNGDCNNNAIPDDCEGGYTYKLNTQSAQLFYWVTPFNGNADAIWLNQYRVAPGGQVLSHIALHSSPYLPTGTPVKVLLYSDPNQDGDPADAELLTSMETTAVAHDNILTFPIVNVAIPPTYVGEPGTFFFIGGVLHCLHLNDFYNSNHNWAPMATRAGSKAYQRSWRAFAPPGQADVYNLTNNASPIQLWDFDPFVIRGIASDCNGNGAWDACEIANGEVPDVNGNGIPDSCDVPDCFFADLAPTGGDGEVNVLDLLHVITNWGVCSPCFAICPGDTNDDCATDVIDLLAVINGWGPCK